MYASSGLINKEFEFELFVAIRFTISCALYTCALLNNAARLTPRFDATSLSDCETRVNDTQIFLVLIYSSKFESISFSSM